MEINKKTIQSIQDCKTFDDVKQGIKDIINQSSDMQKRVNDYEITYNSFIQSLEWFVNPIKSEGRKV
jgi:hypothetical protein